MTDRENAAIEWEDPEGWDGLVRLFDDLVRDSWGGFGADDEFASVVDSASGVFDSQHFIELLKRALNGSGVEYGDFWVLVKLRSSISASEKRNLLS